LIRLTNMVDTAGTTKYAYYVGGLLWTEDGPWASDTVTNYYNTARMRSGQGLAQPTSAWTNGFTYDAAHRLATVISSAGTFTYSYKGPGNLVTNLALPNTLRITNAFDSVAWRNPLASPEPAGSRGRQSAHCSFGGQEFSTGSRRSSWPHCMLNRERKLPVTRRLGIPASAGPSLRVPLRVC
jgi:YD repeat-containing protein